MKKYIVPQCDYEFMKMIRIRTAQGEIVTTFPPEYFEERFSDIPSDKIRCINSDEIQYGNAKILRDYYGLNEQDILELTGCYLQERNGKVEIEKKKIKVFRIEFYDGSKFLCRQKMGCQKLIEDLIRSKKEKLHSLSVKEQSLIITKTNTLKGMAKIETIEMDEEEYLKVTKIAQI